MDSQTPDRAGLESRPVDLSVVVPTYNEAENVPLLIERLNVALAGIAWEVIFVDDDSRDGTAAVARPMCGSCSGSAGAACPPPRSKGRWPVRRPISP
jgi:cellulose synthase/poly-beta-1,6-N-acetylglucosamine synthase-like glycosyltransferase